MSTELVEKIVKARKVGVPLLSVSTPDQFALAEAIANALPKDQPAVSWDCARGLRGLNEEGKNALAGVGSAGEIEASKVASLAFGLLVPKLPKKSTVIALNLQRHFYDPEIVQAVANLRDPFKKSGRILVALAPAVDLPAELRADVVALDDPLPDDAGYSTIIERVHGAIPGSAPATIELAPFVPAVRGLSAFVAEQVLAMSIDTKARTLVKADAWKLKREAIGQTRGLSMTLDGPALADVKGLDQLVGAYRLLFSGPRRPECIVLIDEVEKMMAGLGSGGGPGDNTGVTQDALMNILTSMEGWGWTGSILVGIPGGGKTMFGEAIGAAHGVPLVKLDVGAMKQKHVGESEAAFREAMRAIRNVGRDRVVVLATCNQISAMPPELQSRFRLGTWYIDLPGEEERDAMANVYRARYGLHPHAPMPDMVGWTGREIRNACENAYAFGISPKEAARYLVPISKAEPTSIERLRSLAHGRFLSAAEPGVYDKGKILEPVGAGRQIEG